MSNFDYKDDDSAIILICFLTGLVLVFACYEHSVTNVLLFIAGYIILDPLKNWNFKRKSGAAKLGARLAQVEIVIRELEYSKMSPGHFYNHLDVCMMGIGFWESRFRPFLLNSRGLFLRTDENRSEQCQDLLVSIQSKLKKQKGGLAPRLLEITEKVYFRVLRLYSDDSTSTNQTQGDRQPKHASPLPSQEHTPVEPEHQ